MRSSAFKSGLILATLLGSGLLMSPMDGELERAAREPTKKDDNKYNFTPEELDHYRSLSKKERKEFLKKRLENK